MGTTSHTPEEVADFERATWSRCAAGYDDGFAGLTGRSIDALLDGAGVGPGSRVLDVGTGTGIAASGAVARGATVSAIDFSEAMVAAAARRVPAATVQLASADDLPQADASFDAVVANVTLHHLGRPERAIAEAARVLAPGGRLAATVWDAPERLEAFGLFFAAVAEHAGAAELPHGPLFGVTDRSALTGLLTGNWFGDVAIRGLDTTWVLRDVEPLLAAFGDWADLGAFPDEIRRAIEDSVRTGAERYRTGDDLEIPNPMLLLTATRR